MEYQVNLGNVSQQQPFIPANDPDAPMFASVEGVASPLSEEEVVFQTRGHDEAQVLTTQVLGSMDVCRPFRSVDQHIAAVVNQVQGLQDHQRVRQGLDMLVRTGLMVSDAQVLEQSRERELDPAPLAGLCIRVCDRPDSLKRLLASLAENEQRHGTAWPVIVLDDSRSADAARQYASMLREYGGATEAPVYYVGEREQATLCQRLKHALPTQADAVESLVAAKPGGFGGGRTLNVALLLTAGRRLFLLDEDFELPLKCHPDTRPGVALAASEQHAAWFHPNRDDALDAGEMLAVEAFSAHTNLIGHSLGGALADGPWKVNREALRGMTMSQLRGFAEGYRVVTSFNGTRGSSRMAGSQWMFLLEGASRERFWSDRDDYLRNLQAENIWHAPLQAAPSAQGYLTPFALDNSVLQPCSRASGRNEDALLNTLIRFCHPHSQAMNLPCTIGHLQEAGRGRSKAQTSLQAWQVNVNTFAYETLLNHLDRGMSDDPAQRLRFAADIFEDVASASEARRIEHLRGYINYNLSDLIASLQRQLVSAAEAPVFWRSDIQAMISANAKALLSNQPPRLSEWPEDVDASASAAHLQVAMAGLAADLRAWPAMWHWAAEQGDGLLASL